jgi:hypothetical protein
MSFVTWSPATGITAVWRIAPPREDRDVGRAAADVHEADAELLLVVGQHRERGSELLEHDVLDREPAALHALDDVLRRAVGARDDVHARLEAHARHADRLADALLPVDDEFLRQHVEDLLVRRDRDRLRGVHDARDVAAATSLSLIATMPCELRLRTWLPRCR